MDSEIRSTDVFTYSKVIDQFPFTTYCLVTIHVTAVILSNYPVSYLIFVSHFSHGRFFQEGVLYCRLDCETFLRIPSGEILGLLPDRSPVSSTTCLGVSSCVNLTGSLSSFPGFTEFLSTYFLYSPYTVVFPVTFSPVEYFLEHPVPIFKSGKRFIFPVGSPKGPKK